MRRGQACRDTLFVSLLSRSIDSVRVQLELVRPQQHERTLPISAMFSGCSTARIRQNDLFCGKDKFMSSDVEGEIFKHSFLVLFEAQSQ